MILFWDLKPGSIRLFLERNAGQMSSVTQYIHLCLQFERSQLAPQPGL